MSEIYDRLNNCPKPSDSVFNFDDFFSLIMDVLQEIKKRKLSEQEYESFLKVSTGEYKDTFVSALSKIEEKERNEFVKNLQTANNQYKEDKDADKKLKDLANQMAGLLKKVPERLAEEKQKEEDLKDLKEGRFNPVVFVILQDMLKDETIAKELKESPKKFDALISLGNKLSKEIEDKKIEPGKISEIFIDRIKEKEVDLSEESKSKFLDLCLKIQENESKIIADDVAKKEAAKKKEDDEKAKEKDDKEKAVVLFSEMSKNGAMNLAIATFFSAVLKDESLTKSMTAEQIQGLSALSEISDNKHELTALKEAKDYINKNFADTAVLPALTGALSSVETGLTGTEEDRKRAIETIQQSSITTPRIAEKTAYALLNSDNLEIALGNIEDLYAVADVVKKQKEKGKLPDGIEDKFQAFLKSRLESLEPGEILPSTAKAYLDLCDMAKDRDVASKATDLIARSLVCYDTMNFGSVNPNPDDLEATYNYAKEWIKKNVKSPFESEPKEGEWDLRNIEILNAQGKLLENDKKKQQLKEDLAAVAFEMTAREIARQAVENRKTGKPAPSPEDIEKTYKQSAAQILINAQPDNTKMPKGIWSVKAENLGNSCAEIHNKLEEFNHRAKQKFKDHPWVKSLTGALQNLDKRLENNKTFGEAYKKAKPVLKFVAKTAMGAAKGAAIFTAAGLVPGGPAILLTCYGGKNAIQAGKALFDKELNWKQKVAKVAFHSVSAAFSLAGAAQGFQAAAETFQNMGMEGLSNIMQGTGNVINKGIGAVGQGVTTLAAKTASLIPGIQVQGIPAETITSSLNHMNPMTRVSITATMMAAPDMMVGIKQRFQLWGINRQIKRTTNPEQLKELAAKQNKLHDEHIENLKQIGMKVGGSFIGMATSRAVSPYIGATLGAAISTHTENAMHMLTNDATEDLSVAKEQYYTQSHQNNMSHETMAQNGHTADDLLSLKAQLNTQSHEDIMGQNLADNTTGSSQAEFQQHNAPDGNLGHTAAPREDPEPVVQNTDETHNIKPLSEEQLQDMMSKINTHSQEATTIDTIPDPLHPAENTPVADAGDFKYTKDHPLEYNHNGAAFKVTGATAEALQTEMENLKSGEISNSEYQDRAKAILEDGWKNGETEAPGLKPYQATAEAQNVDNQPQSITEAFNKDEPYTTVTLNGETHNVTAKTAEAFMAEEQRYQEGLKDGTIPNTAASRMEHRQNLQDILAEDYLKGDNTNAPQHTANTTSTGHAAAATVVTESVNAAVSQVSSEETITQTIRFPNGAEAQAEVPANRSNIGGSTFTTRTEVEITGDPVVDNLNLNKAVSGTHADGTPAGYKFEGVYSNDTGPSDQAVQQAQHQATQSSQQEQVITRQPHVDIIPDPTLFSVPDFVSPHQAEDFWLSQGYRLSYELNHDLRNDAAMCVLEPIRPIPGQPTTCIVITPFPNEETGTFYQEVSKAELNSQIRGSHGNAGFYSTEPWNNHNVRPLAGIGLIEEAARLVDNVKGLFGLGHGPDRVEEFQGNRQVNGMGDRNNDGHATASSANRSISGRGGGRSW